MDIKFLNTLLYLSAIMSVVGLAYTIFGVFLGGIRGFTTLIRGTWARVFGLFYLILALPVLAFSYGATQAPSATWYQAMQVYVSPDNYLFWLIGWVIALLFLHIVSGLVGSSD